MEHLLVKVKNKQNCYTELSVNNLQFYPKLGATNVNNLNSNKCLYDDKCSIIWVHVGASVLNVRACSTELRRGGNRGTVARNIERDRH